ncbi:unnamed protein product [Tilletia controversa]|uniref:Uncharacterized protein n=3 Tax=Tilletia TaxID=13289 RepID=A0A8X7N049_9BASI|nr:hypothetical protein CF336_g454 [Tilletia laevis]KAE8205585.1 hypothetical protein CF328_g419 [Tilletia controversa]KAE8265465.1 hypothetical protein A4X03_0g244 [Tilletia caries]KAE8208757.1 hypothetical protein CF335_g184 [Tilletia laevis]KAE8255267.1 hypothetical protein A4X06_0g515 [Tilletia controversa]
MPLFVLSPASLAHSALFAGYYSYLAANVIALRFKTGITLGQGESSTDIRKTDKNKVPNPAAEVKLRQAVRAYGNFIEGTPLAFLLLFIAELNGAPTALVHGAFTTLFAGRVLHSVGIRAEDSVGFGRPVGMITTITIIIGTGLYNLRLGYEPLKSFLGAK